VVVARPETAAGVDATFEDDQTVVLWSAKRSRVDVVASQFWLRGWRWGGRRLVGRARRCCWPPLVRARGDGAGAGGGQRGRGSGGREWHRAAACGCGCGFPPPPLRVSRRRRAVTPPPPPGPWRASVRRTGTVARGGVAVQALFRGRSGAGAAGRHVDGPRGLVGERRVCGFLAVCWPRPRAGGGCRRWHCRSAAAHRAAFSNTSNDDGCARLSWGRRRAASLYCAGHRKETSVRLHRAQDRCSTDAEAGGSSGWCVRCHGAVLRSVILGQRRCIKSWCVRSCPSARR